MSDAIHESANTSPEAEAPVSGRARRRRSRYYRPRRAVSWPLLVFGIAAGLAGGLFWAWNVDEIEQFDVAPRQLNLDAKYEYVVAIMLDYGYDGNVNRAVDRLITLDLPGSDPIQQVADIACELAEGGYVNNDSGLHAVRTMMRFYQGQQRGGCADELIPLSGPTGPEVVEIDVPTPTPRPPASKTPTPQGTPAATATPPRADLPTSAPVSDFSLALNPRTFCDADTPGIIEVLVQQASGQGFPGQPVRVRWTDGESVFFTGLKPEEGPGYADFEMEAGLEYIIDMPGLADPWPNPLPARTCFTDSGEETIISYQVVFREN